MHEKAMFKNIYCPREVIEDMDKNPIFSSLYVNACLFNFVNNLEGDLSDKNCTTISGILKMILDESLRIIQLQNH